MTNAASKWKYVTIGALVILAVGVSFPQAFAHVTNSLSHNVGHILAAIATLSGDVSDVQDSVDAVQSDVDGLETGVATLTRKAITVKVVAPAESGQVEILPLDIENGRMYTGHINGIMSLGAVPTTGLSLNCAVNLANAPLASIADLDSLPTPEFQAIIVDEEFTCTSLTLSYGGTNPSSTITDLAISYVQIDGTEEIEE